MLSNYRTPAPNDDVLAAIGRAIYNYSYLEWGVIWTVAWLREDTSQVNWLATRNGGTIADALTQAVKDCAPPEIREELRVWAEAFGRCTVLRNDLLHAHPYTADSDTGDQGLWRVRRGLRGDSFSVAVTADEMHVIAKRFEDTMIEGAPLRERLRPSTHIATA
jgi:hypothetical protein